jgi:hypothetical protein
VLGYLGVVHLENAVRVLPRKIPDARVRRLHALIDPWRNRPPEVALGSLGPLNPHLRYRYRFVELDEGLETSALEPGDVLLVPSRDSGLCKTRDPTPVADALRADSRAEVLVDDPLLLVVRWTGGQPSGPRVKTIPPPATAKP